MPLPLLAGVKVHRDRLRSTCGAHLAQCGMSYGERNVSRSFWTAGDLMDNYFMILAVPLALRIAHAILVLGLSRHKSFGGTVRWRYEQMQLQTPYKPAAIAARPAICRT